MNPRKGRSSMFFALCASITLLVLLIGGTCSAAGNEGAKIPKLQGSLKELSDSYAAGAKEKVASMVSSERLFASDDKIRVMLDIAPGATLTESELASYGVEVERKHDTFWRVLAPIGSLQRLAAEMISVSYIHAPRSFIPEYRGEGPGLTHAYPTWHSAGYNGSGVKVAVIDHYFGFLSNAVSNGDIPSDHVERNFTGRSFTEAPAGIANWHGTCCAEIVMDMAPDCDLYLIKIDDLSDLIAAKDYCVTNGIKVISTSFGYYNEGDYAGNGPVCDVVNNAYSNGILWVKSAGNNAAGGHYAGDYSDANANNWHNFSGADETNSLGYVQDYADWDDRIQLYLSWGWPTSNQDYDLFLYREGVASPVASSTNPQTGTEPPTEEIDYLVTIPGTYYVKIQRVSATGPASFQLFSPGSGILEYNSAASSLSLPADASGCFVVGGLHRCLWSTGTSPAAYSSRGPTLDGRIKPEITGPTMVNIGILYHDTTCPNPTQGFGGTSSAAPHAAGAAALVLEAYPASTVGQVWSFLTGRAIDKGPAGQDNDWGYGLLDMGAIPSAEALTVTSPNGGEIWFVGSSHNITWTSSGVSALVDIDFSADGGATWTAIFSNTANDGIEPWTIPDEQSTNCLVRITDNDGSPSDASNAPFTISTETPGCDPLTLSLLGYRTVSWNPPYWQVQVQILNNAASVPPYPHANDVVAVMNEEIPWLTIPDPTCAYHQLCPGQDSWGEADGYTFDLTNHPGGSFNVWFDVTFTDDCGNPYRVRLDPEFEPGLAGDTPVTIEVTRLGQNYPNPFNPSTTIGFQIATAGPVHLGIYDVSGKLVRTVVDRHLNSGAYAANWDGKDANGVSVASGIYFYKMRVGAFAETKKMVLMR